MLEQLTTFLPRFLWLMIGAAAAALVLVISRGRSKSSYSAQAGQILEKLADIQASLTALNTRVDNLPNREQMDSHKIELRTQSNNLANVLRQIEMKMPRPEPPPEAQTDPREARAVAARSDLGKRLDVERVDDGRARQISAVSPSADASSASVASIVMSKFDEIDRDTNRNFPDLKKRFEQMLGSRVSRIEDLDNAVLFYTSKDSAIVYPWINARLRPRWLPFFDLDRGANVPIASVERPAAIRMSASGDWELLEKGYGRNDN